MSSIYQTGKSKEQYKVLTVIFDLLPHASMLFQNNYIVQLAKINQPKARKFITFNGLKDISVY